jgi:PAS domain S-box-containing protein
MQPLQAGAQQLLEAVWDAADDAILSVSLGEGTILTWSRSAERIYEYSEGDILGRSLQALLPRSRHNEAALLAQSIVLGQRVEGFESEHLTQSGKPVTVSVNAAAATRRKRPNHRRTAHGARLERAPAHAQRTPGFAGKRRSIARW